MKILQSIQKTEMSDAVRAKFAMTIPVLQATASSLAGDRARRLGGYSKLTMADLAREAREGNGDAGICFELAVHQAIEQRHPLLHPIVSEVLEKFCAIPEGAESILFGPEKNHVIPILESTQNALTEDSLVWVGNQGRPPKLKKYIPQIINAFRRNEAKNNLPRSISGLWKADLFLGGKKTDRWLGTTIKINVEQLVGARGLRLGIYPKKNANDNPRKDDDLNLIRIPLPYDGAFMEAFYKSFYLVRAFLKADARVPPPISLPDAEDRFITKELELRRDFPVIDVLDVIEDMSQPDLFDRAEVGNIEPAASLTEAGLKDAPAPSDLSDMVSLSPFSLTKRKFPLK